MLTFSDLTSALRATVEEAKQGDDMAPVHVLAPSGRAAQAMAQELARSGGCVNVRCQTMEQMAWRLLSSRCKSSRLTSHLENEVVRRAALDARPPLGRGALNRLIDVLGGAFDDIRQRSAPEVEALANGNPLARELVRLYRCSRAMVGSRLDTRDAVEHATVLVDEATCSLTVVAVVLEPLRSFEVDFLSSIQAHGRLYVIEVFSGEQALDDALGTSLWGFDRTKVVPRAIPRVESIVVAPDAEEEVRNALSTMIEAAASGHRFGEMALLFINPSPYSLIAFELFQEAGVPTRGRHPTSLAKTTIGRFIDGLFKMIDDDYSATSVEEWMMSCQLIEPSTGEAVDGSAWARAARAARVSYGSRSQADRSQRNVTQVRSTVRKKSVDYASTLSSMSQWRSRLGYYATTREARDAGLAEHAIRCAMFIEQLAADMSVSVSSWRDWSSFVMRLLDKYLGPPEVRASWPDAQRSIADDIERVLADMATLDELGSSCEVDASVFHSSLMMNIDRVWSDRSSPDGVFIGTIREARGCRFAIAVMCGLGEGMMPKGSHGDAVASALRVPGEESPGEREHRLYCLARSLSDRVILTLPRVDVRKQRERHPSQWLMSEASRLAGRVLASKDVTHGEDLSPWLCISPSFTSVVEADRPSTEMLSRLSCLASAGLPVDEFVDIPALGRSMHVVRERDSPFWSRFDGVIGDHFGLRAVFDAAQSPTALEQWAECPYRYFLGSILQIDRGDVMGDTTATAPIDRGSLVHAVLETFVRDVPSRRSPDHAWSDDERSRLHVIADELYEELKQHGRSPIGLLYEVELGELHRHLDAVLGLDSISRRESGVMTDGKSVEISVSCVAGKKTPVTFRGRIDRVDRSHDGSHLVAIDYKTGRADKCPDLSVDPVDGGRRLQLAMYARGLAEKIPTTRVDAQYWYVTDDRSGYARRTVTIDERAEQRLDEVVDVAVSSIQAGVFPPTPGVEVNGTYENCRKCPYDQLCPADRGELWDRKIDERVVTALDISTVEPVG